MHPESFSITFSMKKLVIALLLCSVTTWGQVRKAKAFEADVKSDTIRVIQDPEALKFTFNRYQQAQQKWFKFNQVGLNMSEVAFSNWNAGGESSISGIMNAKFRRRYIERTFFWDNELEINYGINAQKGREVRKTDDKLSLISSFGYRGDSQSFWYYTARYQFLSQISNGYNYPDVEKPISKFLAPAYITFGLGAEYAPAKIKFNLFLSPITLKTTAVFDQRLADDGAFGVEKALRAPDGTILKKGKRTHNELGFSVSGRWDKKIMENMMLNTSFNLYGDYLKNFGNIDVDWETNLNLKVNNYVQARIGVHIKYDDDVKFYSYTAPNGEKHNYGARTQLKQILGVGVLYTF